MLDWAIILARLVQFLAVLVLFGSSLFCLYGLKAGGRSPSRAGWPRKILLSASIAGLAGTIAWVLAETAYLNDDISAAFDPGSLWSLLSQSRIGRIYIVRAVLLAASIATFWVPLSNRKLWAAQGMLGAAAVASFAWSGHGARDHGFIGAVHVTADVLHLLAAGLWVGALAGLSVLVVKSFRSRSIDDARIACHGLDAFSAIGLSVVAILLLSGLVNTWFLIGIARWRAFFTTAYGLTLAAKLVLFGLMLMLAAANRLRLCPQLNTALRGACPVDQAVGLIRRSVLAETSFAVLILGMVALLGTFEPPIAN